MEWVAARGAQARAAGARRRLPHLHRRPRHRPQLRPARAAGACEQLRRPVPAADAGRRGRLDERSGLVQPGEADDLHARECADPGRRRLGPLHLRLDQRRDGQLRPRPDRQQRGRQGRQQGGREPDAWRVGRREAQARLRFTGRQDGRLLRQADRPQRRCLAVPALLHVRPAAERELQRARAGGLGRLRRDAGGQLPDLDRSRLRAARGADRRRGHLRRAGADVGRRALRVPELHRQHARLQARRAVPGQPGHGRVQPPVPRAAHEDGPGWATEPLLRRRQRRRHEGRAARQAGGLHPRRVPRGRRHARRSDAG